MIAYNKTWLDNLFIKEEAENAFYLNHINSSEKENIESLYPVGFYTPNFFIRIGLFFLTVVIAGFSLGLLALLLMDNIENSFKGIILFFGLAAYGMLEFFVRSNKHYRSGVDDALLWISAFSIIISLNLLFEFSFLTNAIIIFIVAGYFSVRFADWVMTCITTIAFLAIIFLFYLKAGTFARFTVPFILMGVCSIIYFFIKKIFEQKKYSHYYINGIVVQTTLLFGFYLAGNYFAVTEMSKQFFHSLKENESISLGWLFWIFTVAIPVLYIWWGVKKKDVVLIRAGLILIAAMIFTIRFYYAVLPLETAMVLGGIFLIAVSYALTKYLATSKNGFTSAELLNQSAQNKLNIEALIISETFGNIHSPAAATNFGGGSGGGAGASGEF